jgi:phosphotriesterase-related protein
MSDQFGTMRNRFPPDLPAGPAAPGAQPRQPVIRTTGGDIDPQLLGPTSTHEHVLVDASVWYRIRRPEDKRFEFTPVSPETIADVRWHAYSFRDNLRLDDTKAARDGLRRFRAAGGHTIVDLTTVGLSPRPDAVAALAQSAQVNVIHGAGYYTHPSHSPDVCAAGIEALETSLDDQVTGGVAGSDILPGILGEIGMSAPPQECERTVLRAAARVAARWGMSVVVHVDGGGAFGRQHVADCAGQGLPPERVICGHMDEHIDAAYHRDLLREGATLAFDTFGSELKFSGLFDHPSDATRMRCLADLLEEGWAHQVVLGHDVFLKAHLHEFGGNGYEHLLARVLPTLEAAYGISPSALEQLLVDNPRRHLTCTPPDRCAAPRQPAGAPPDARPTGAPSTHD